MKRREFLARLGLLTVTPLGAKPLLATPQGVKTHDELEWYELILAEDCPGKGIIFNAFKKTWCKTDHTWRYEYSARQVWAVDWRHAVPRQKMGDWGLFIPRPSTTYGTVYECVWAEAPMKPTEESNGIPPL